MSVTCANCHDPLVAYADEVKQLGRCCVNLPPRWGYDGLTVVSESDDEDSPGYPQCQCGGTQFDIQITDEYNYTFYGRDNEPGDERIWIDRGDIDNTDVSIRCYDCGASYRGEWEWV